MRKLMAPLVFALAIVSAVAGGWEGSSVALKPLITYEAATTQTVQFPGYLSQFRARRIQRFWDTDTGMAAGRSLRGVFDQVELTYDGPYDETFYDALIAFQAHALAGKTFKFDGQYGDGISGAWPVEGVYAYTTLKVYGPGFGDPLWPLAGGRPFIVYRVPEQDNPEIRDRVILDYTEPVTPFGNLYWVYLEAPGLTRTDYPVGETMMRPEYTYVGCIVISERFYVDLLDADRMQVVIHFRDYAEITTP